MMRPLKPNIVELWQVPLDNEAECERVQANLIPTEHERARRLIVPAAKRRFMVARGVLREILAQYLACKPADVLFQHMDEGKPYIAGGSLEFNIAHSGDKALIAITKEYPLGVDIEAIVPRGNLLGLAERFFHPEEVRALQQHDEQAQLQAFYRYWCVKEAVLKGQGVGIPGHLSDFVVSFREKDIDLAWHTEPNSAEACDWQVQMLDVASGFIGALALKDNISFDIRNLYYNKGTY